MFHHNKKTHLSDQPGYSLLMISYRCTGSGWCIFITTFNLEFSELTKIKFQFTVCIQHQMKVLLMGFQFSGTQIQKEHTSYMSGGLIQIVFKVICSWVTTPNCEVHRPYLCYGKHLVGISKASLFHLVILSRKILKLCFSPLPSHNISFGLKALQLLNYFKKQKIMSA